MESYNLHPLTTSTRLLPPPSYYLHPSRQPAAMMGSVELGYLVSFYWWVLMRWIPLVVNRVHIRDAFKKHTHDGQTEAEPNSQIYAVIHSDGTLVRASCRLQRPSFLFPASPFGRSSLHVSHWLVIVIVSYISLFRKPAPKQTAQLHTALHAQHDRAMHKLR